MHIKTEKVTDTWTLYTLINNNDIAISVLNYGGIITRILTPDKHGNNENIVLGYEQLSDYTENPNRLGAIIGPVAGRIANAEFTLDDKTYHLEKNDGKHHLHGGEAAFNRVIWDAKPFRSAEEVGITLTHQSPDGGGGYPGNVNVTVTYTLNNHNQLIMNYDAESDATTPLALTNHSYFNLSGDLKNTVHNHQVTLDSSRFAELDQALIPTGNRLDVASTVFDFRIERQLAGGLNSNAEQIQIAGGGYDHYFIFDDHRQEDVVVRDPASGRMMTVKTDQPGMVMYTANGLDDELTLKERHGQKHLGVCFETQGSPASLHHNSFPNIVLESGESYRKQTVFTFITDP